jgi:glycosyltransferase involved in cell wall biosynthesis
LNILFVTWDGPQVSYLEGLFLPIFKALKSDGIQVHILQFTWGDTAKIEQCRNACQDAGCSYEMVTVIRSPVALGSLFSAVMGYRHIRRVIKQKNIDVVMPRSTLPALSSLLALRGRSEYLVFDADGLPLDERVDFAGQSPFIFIHRLLREIEAQAVGRSDLVLTRSMKAVDILLARAGAGTLRDKFFVVSNGRDTNVFAPSTVEARIATRARLGLTQNTPLLVYAGSIGPQYCIGEMLRLFELVREQRADTRLLILTGSPELVAQALQSKLELIDLIIIKSVAPERVPAYLACADLGLAFRQPTFSMQGVAPIKLGEYLLCGLPLVATRGVGDTHNIDDTAGFMVDKMDELELQSVAQWFVEQVLPGRDTLRDHCRAVGLKHFSLQASAAVYQRALSSLMQK